MLFEISNTETIYGEKMENIIRSSDEHDKIELDSNFVGKSLIFTGKRCKEAGEYYQDNIQNCHSVGDEIKLHFEILNQFEVVVRPNY